MGSTRCMGRASSTTLMRGGLGAAAVLGVVLTTGSGGFTTGAMRGPSVIMFSNPPGTPFGAPSTPPVTPPVPAATGASSIDGVVAGIAIGANSLSRKNCDAAAATDFGLTTGPGPG